MRSRSCPSGTGEGVLGKGSSICAGSKVGTVLVCAGHRAQRGELSEARRGNASHHENPSEARESSGCLINLRGVGQGWLREGHQGQTHEEGFVLGAPLGGRLRVLSTSHPSPWISLQPGGGPPIMPPL